MVLTPAFKRPGTNLKLTACGKAQKATSHLAASEAPPLEDHWSRSGDTITGRDANGSAPTLMFGKPAWKNYEFAVQLRPLKGSRATVQFRLSADQRQCYQLELCLDWQAVAISKIDPATGSTTQLSVIRYPLEMGREYEAVIALHDNSITSYIDGKLVNQLTDAAIATGKLGLRVWQGETAFRAPRIRMLP